MIAAEPKAKGVNPQRIVTSTTEFDITFSIHDQTKP